MRRPFIIPKELRKKVIFAALGVADSVRVDELDCKKSFARQDTKLLVNEVIELGLSFPNTLYNFIYRPPICSEPAYYDIGLSTMNIGTNYFLWINVSILNGDDLIQKFGLKEKVL